MEGSGPRLHRESITRPKVQRKKYSLSNSKRICLLLFLKAASPSPSLYYKVESNKISSPCHCSAMSPRRVLEVRSDDHNSQKWRVSLTEDAFNRFINRGGDDVRKVFGEGSLFSPLLFGKFFDPGDAFPLWEFESEALLSGLRSASKTSVDWAVSNGEYVLRAELPGARKIDIEISGEKGKVLEISGQWRGRESDSKDWRTGNWWEHGFVRRLEMPDGANWRRIEACIDNDTFLEIKIPKNSSGQSDRHANGVDLKESEYV